MALPPETRVPSIPNPAIDPEGFLRAVQEVVQVREGARGNPLDRGVTFRDLVDAGMAAPNPAFAGKGRIPASALITPTGAGGAGGALGTGVRPAMTVPPKPRDVVAVGTFTSILIAWAQPDYSNHAHAEILRAAVNDIGQAVAIGSSVGRQYADAVGTDADYYYWVRYVSTGNVKGPASASVRGKTALDPQYVMANLLSTTWQPNTAYTEFQYVRPTVDNGLMYRCTQDGTSGATEPVWPTVIGGIRTDGTVKWTTVAQTERVPFTIGTVNGQPAVVMDTAYIADATITVAKIKDAFLDNLTAIHGTLNFARIEQGNIFDLTIGGDIKSETFSPFNNTGFIIRNEPGRDPTTPGIREYVAEFYGDTLFSGDIRAARILGGVIVGNIFGVPSDVDNGSFEYISNRDVVSSSVTGERSDGFGFYEFTHNSLARRVLNYSGGGYHPIAGVSTSHTAVVGDLSTTLSFGRFNIGGRYELFLGYIQKMLPGLTFHRSKVRTNPLAIISARANAPYNYNRYRHLNVTTRVTFNRNGFIGADVFPRDSFGPPRSYLIIRLYRGQTNELLETHPIAFGPSSLWYVHEIPVTSQYSPNIQYPAYVNFNGPKIRAVMTFEDVPAPGNPGLPSPRTWRVLAGSFIEIKNTTFDWTVPEGISCELEVATFDQDGNIDTYFPAGMNVGFTFSSSMDNTV